MFFIFGLAHGFMAHGEFEACSDLLLRSGGGGELFHNARVKAELGSSGMNLERLLRTVELLSRMGAYDIPVAEHGFVAAANVGDHHGGYGQFFWLRDLARVYQGLYARISLMERLASARPDVDYGPRIEKARTDARRVALALVRTLAERDWRERAVANILNPALHFGETGHSHVLKVRRMLLPFAENRPATADELAREIDWGHKQNDALSEFAHAVLDSLNHRILAVSDVPSEARINLLLLPAYFTRLQYWRMWDAGAWEEKLAARTSSIGLVTSLQERLLSGLRQEKAGFGPEYRFFGEVREGTLPLLEPSLGATAARRVLAALRPRTGARVVSRGLEFLRTHIYHECGLREALTGDHMATRCEDTAIFHLLWHPPRGLDDETALRIVSRLSVLEGASGYARYRDDWFLYGAAEAAKYADALGLSDSVAIPDGLGGYKRASAQDLALIRQEHKERTYDKNMENVVRMGGQGLEAQWTMPDAYLTSFYAELYARDGEETFLRKAFTMAAL
ncbi:MAG: hypothetical protein HC902_06995, partial [Calothrix sp. SM1_5_4]|nr:hypothetical protein [Calothrix sp. SM1_5_4]